MTRRAETEAVHRRLDQVLNEEDRVIILADRHHVSCYAVRSGVMQIVITSDVAAVEDQTRAYAEYKVFSSLAPRAREIDRVEVVLAKPSSSQSGAETECAVTVHLAGGGSEHTSVRMSGAYAAIDRAAVRVEAAMNRRAARRPSS